MFVATFDAIHHAPANFLTTDSGRAPVDKEAELGIAEPLKALFELLWGFVELRCWGWLCSGIVGAMTSEGGGQQSPVWPAIRGVLFFA